MGTLKKRCVIIGSGDCSLKILKKHIADDDFVICADGGYNYAVSADITPDLLIGDFDSIGTVPDFPNTVSLPVEKDVTDCEAAYIEGRNRGFTEFYIFGGTGGRFEHTFANISLAAKAAAEGCICTVLDDRHTVRALCNSTLILKNKPNTQISVFAFGGEARNVSETGFHYTLDNVTLSPYTTLGTSNDIVADFGTISVGDGVLIIIETEM